MLGLFDFDWSRFKALADWYPCPSHVEELNPPEYDDPATDWQGLHTVDEAITILNPPNGWIQNANSTPFTAAAEFSPKRADYPVYMAPDDENFRGVHAVRMLADVDDLTLDGLIELAHDPYLPGFEKLVALKRIHRHLAKEKRYVDMFLDERLGFRACFVRKIERKKIENHVS